MPSDRDTRHRQQYRAGIQTTLKGIAGNGLVVLPAASGHVLRAWMGKWKTNTVTGTLQRHSAAVYQKVLKLEDKLVEKPLSREEPEKRRASSRPTPHDPRKRFCVPFTRFFII